MTPYDQMTDKDRQKARKYFEDRVVRGNGCWSWAGHVATGTGYAYASTVGFHGPAHRLSYQIFIGPIPDGLHLDHLCRIRSCVNPQHVEPVTPAENVLRGVGITATNAHKTHCLRGHPFLGDNLLRRPDGSRGCRICKNNSGDKRNARRPHKAGVWRAIVRIDKVETLRLNQPTLIDYVRVLECGHTQTRKFKLMKFEARKTVCRTCSMRPTA